MYSPTPLSFQEKNTLSTNSERVHPFFLLFSNSSPVPLVHIVYQLDQCPRNIKAQFSLEYVVSAYLQQLPYLCLGSTHRHITQLHKLYEILVVLVLDD